MYSLDQIRSFVAVAEEMHFGRAAERLNMTQPPLSRQIQKLEKEIGVLLLTRDNRRVALTTAGAAFLTEARRLLTLAESAPELARQISAGSTGILRIGFTAVAALEVLGRLLNTISINLPGIYIELHEMVTSEQNEALENGEVDLGLVRPPVDEERFDSITIQQESLLVVVPDDHILTHLSRPVMPDDLRDEAMVMQSPINARYFYDLVARHAPESNMRTSHTASQILTIIALVSAKRGIALVPESARILGYNGVRFLEFASDSPKPVELKAIWARDSINPALPRVTELIASEAQER